jgi:hypothetical protein
VTIYKVEVFEGSVAATFWVAASSPDEARTMVEERLAASMTPPLLNPRMVVSEEFVTEGHESGILSSHWTV